MGPEATGVLDSVKRLAVGSAGSGSLSTRARERRAETLYRTFPELPDMTVLDLGGRPSFWAGMVRPRRVVTVNLEPQPQTVEWVEHRCSDACHLPSDLASGWDLVLSNSTIEHVGGHAMRLRFAEVVHKAGRHYWVQTPNRWFPLEPHWLFPCVQWLPTGAKARVSAYTPGRRQRDRQRAIESAMSVELLTSTELQHYFPEAAILRERFFGATKSLIATA